MRGSCSEPDFDVLQRWLQSRLRSARQKMSKVPACKEQRDQPALLAVYLPRTHADKTARTHRADLAGDVCGPGTRPEIY